MRPLTPGQANTSPDPLNSVSTVEKTIEKNAPSQLTDAAKSASFQNVAVAPPSQGAFSARPASAQPYKHNDVHFHHTNYTQQGSMPRQLIPAMNALNIHRTVLAPIPTNQVACCNGDDYIPALGKASTAHNYYIPNGPIRDGRVCKPDDYEKILKGTPPLVYNTAVDDLTADMYKRLDSTVKDRFDPMVTGLVLGDQRCSDDLLMKLHRHPGVFSGVGEITIHKEFVEDKLDQRVQANLKTNINPTIDLFKTCGEVGLPVVMHCDVDVMPHKRGQEPAHLDDVKRLLRNAECKNTNIIWAHAGGLGKYSYARPDHLDNIEKILKDPGLKHVHFDLSWDVVAAQLLQKDYLNSDKALDNTKLDKLVAMLEAHPDRFLFGSDSLAPRRESDWGATIDTYAPLLDKLKPETREKLLTGNYERLIVGSRAKVRAYETYCLPYANIAIRLRQDALNTQPEFVNQVMHHVHRGIEFGKLQMDAALTGKSTPNMPDGLMKVNDLEDFAWQVRPGDGAALRSAPTM